VIHRDLSPRNVMPVADGEVKLVDFGIAVTLGEGDGARARSRRRPARPVHVARAGAARATDRQTDLFSVGVLMWEMLVGHRLFARSDLRRDAQPR